ncbi:MAG: T9SS type A sorting domain-containing protein [Bacteroidota bacterium]
MAALRLSGLLLLALGLATPAHAQPLVSANPLTASIAQQAEAAGASASSATALARAVSHAVPTEEQTLNASDASSRDQFGISVSLSGDRALVGAVGDDCADGGDLCGSAYVFAFDGSSWVEEAKLTAAAASADDRFGIWVSLSGDRALVGAPRDACTDGGDFCGSAYVFTFDGTQPVGSRWIEEAKLTASDASAGDQFGFSVSLVGDRALVGAVGDACADGDFCGSVYVFTFDGTQPVGSRWIEEAKLTASDASSIDQFGISVSLAGDRALVGAVGDACADGGDICGSAYVFTFDGSSWIEEAKLTASDASAGDQFGILVLSGDRALVGAPGDACADGGDICGSAYVFTFDGSNWVEEAKLTASDASTGDQFGAFVSLSGDRALVGAFTDVCANGGRACGAAYVFAFDGTQPVGSQWVEEAKLTASDASTGDVFGRSVSLAGDRALVGAPGDACAEGDSCGSVYTFIFPPSNDALATNTRINGAGTITGSNRAATVDSGEPEASCLSSGATGASVWWAFQPLVTGTATLDFANSTFDTVVSLYAFEDGSLTEVACNDDAVESVLTSRLEAVPVEAGVIYVIRVAGFDNGTGPAQGAISFELTFADPPLNDPFAIALGPLTLDETVSATNMNATLEDGEAEASCLTGGSTGASVWWFVRPPAAGMVSFDFAASDFDTVVSFYPDTNPVLPALSDELACNDDVSESVRTSRLVDVPVEEGQQYVLRVAGFDNSVEGPETGTVAFDYTFTPAVASEDAAEVALELVVSPNPVASSLAVSVTLAEPQAVTVEVVDALGRRVAVLADGRRPAGASSWRWDVDRQPAGVYVVRLRAGEEVRTERVTVVR